MNERDILYYYNNCGPIDTKLSISKWSPIIQNLTTFELSKNNIEKLSIFAERYSYVENAINPTTYTTLPSSYRSIPPEWFMSLVDAIKSFTKVFEKYMEKNTRLSIKKEYFNILTMKKGIELENGIFIEDNIIVKNEAYNNIMTNFEKCIDEQIKYIIDIGYRTRKLRKEKLDKINSTIF